MEKLSLHQGFEYIKDTIPRNPGVYRYFDSTGQIIYVGKAKSLRNRVGSYFSTKIIKGSKTYALVSNIASMDFIITDSELEALILEATLIKKLQPKYNITLKDDKSNLYIVIRKDKNLHVPSVLLVRKTDLLETDVAFGPYSNSDTARTLYKAARKIFKFRDCSATKFTNYRKAGRPCLFGHIGMCLAPCVHNIPEEISTYKTSIKRFEKFLDKGAKPVVKELNTLMISKSKTFEYEEAAEIRDILKKLEGLSHNFKVPDQYIENPHLIEDLAKLALQELVAKVPSLSALPLRIECYDISNLSGKEAVGSMVVATNGIINKKEYKRFKIKFKQTPDDFEMLREVLTRRLSHELPGAKVRPWGMPDLLVIDGGKGQISTINEVLISLGLNIPLIGLAKRFETIVYKDEVSSEFIEISLPKDNGGLSLLIRLRDEAHRFAQAYHHKLRLNKLREGRL